MLVFIHLVQAGTLDAFIQSWKIHSQILNKFLKLDSEKMYEFMKPGNYKSPKILSALGKQLENQFRLFLVLVSLAPNAM